MKRVIIKLIHPDSVKRVRYIHNEICQSQWFVFQQIKKENITNLYLHFVFFWRCFIFKQATLALESLLKVVNHFPTRLHLRCLTAFGIRLWICFRCVALNSLFLYIVESLTSIGGHQRIYECFALILSSLEVRQHPFLGRGYVKIWLLFVY